MLLRQSCCSPLLSGAFKSGLSQIEDLSVSSTVFRGNRLSLQRAPPPSSLLEETQTCSYAVTAGTAGQEVLALSFLAAHTHTQADYLELNENGARWTEF